MNREQYVVTAVHKEQGTASRYIRLVTYDGDDAYGYDVSLYEGNNWNVFVENFLVDDDDRVVAKRQTKIIYPQQQE